MNERIRIVVADITTLEVDAIVNAANSSLLGGGGVDGAIHRAAGPGLLEECRGLRGCETGSAKRTSGHALRADHVFHAVGPVWQGGEHDEPNLLASCYRTCLALAHEHQVESVAFPAISTGVYSYPIEAATRIALREVSAWLATNDTPKVVLLCCFSEGDAEVYRRVLAESAHG